MPPDDRTEQKTEKPTRRKRRRAREQGQVAQSAEINSVLVLAGGLGAISLLGGYSYTKVALHMADCLADLHTVALSMDGAAVFARRSLWTFLVSAAPTLVFVGTVALFASVVQTGFVFAPSKLAPNLNLINPVRGFKNLCSLGALVRLCIAAAKLAIRGTHSAWKSLGAGWLYSLTV